MKRYGAKALTQRQFQVSEQIRHVLAWTFERGEIHDPAIQGRIITVTEVKISPDLRCATAFVMPLGGSLNCNFEDVLSGLNRAAPFLRKQVARSVHLRKVPKLNFTIDNSFDGARYIDQLLQDPVVVRDLIKKEKEESVDEVE